MVSSLFFNTLTPYPSSSLKDESLHTYQTLTRRTNKRKENQRTGLEPARHGLLVYIYALPHWRYSTISTCSSSHRSVLETLMVVSGRNSNFLHK